MLFDSAQPSMRTARRVRNLLSCLVLMDLSQAGRRADGWTIQALRAGQTGSLPAPPIRLTLDARANTPAAVNPNSSFGLAAFLRLLADPKVAAWVAEIRAKVAERTEITLETVLREVARLAFSDHRALFRENGSLKAPHELDNDIAAAVASVEVLEVFEGRGKARVLVGHTKKAHAPLHTIAREFWVFPRRACGYVCGYFSAWLVQKCFALSGLVRVGAALGNSDRP